MVGQHSARGMSVDEWRALERTGHDTKHEYIDGQVYGYHPTQPWRTGDGDRNGPHAACYR